MCAIRWGWLLAVEEEAAAEREARVGARRGAVGGATRGAARRLPLRARAFLSEALLWTPWQPGT